MCAPALPYVAACLTVAARPPERRRRSGAFGRRRERPPRPRAWYGFGRRCVFTPLPPSLGVAPDLSIPGGKAIRVPPTGGLMGLASGSALTGRMRSTVVREAAPMPELVRAPTGRLDFGAASRYMNFACSASRATLVPRGTILVYRHAWGALGGPIRAGGAVRDVDDPVQAWQGGTSTLARTPTRSALRPTPTPRRIQPSEASARLAAHVAEGVGARHNEAEGCQPAGGVRAAGRSLRVAGESGRPPAAGRSRPSDGGGSRRRCVDVRRRPAPRRCCLPAAPALRCTRARAGHRPASSLVHIIHGRAPQCYEQQRLQVFCWPSSKRAR